MTKHLQVQLPHTKPATLTGAPPAHCRRCLLGSFQGGRLRPLLLWASSELLHQSQTPGAAARDTEGCVVAEQAGAASAREAKAEELPPRAGLCLLQGRGTQCGPSPPAVALSDPRELCFVLTAPGLSRQAPGVLEGCSHHSAAGARLPEGRAAGALPYAPGWGGPSRALLLHRLWFGGA